MMVTMSPVGELSKGPPEEVVAAKSANQQAPKRIVLISEHDYRTARRANFQPIADALVRLGHDVTFISVRYSLLSMLRQDSRNLFRSSANKADLHEGVTCYLWRTAIHPFNVKTAPGLRGLSTPLYRLYRKYPDQFVDDSIRSASIVIVESGLGAILLERARALNRDAKLIYYASDMLDMIGAHPFVQRCLEQSGGFVDHVCLASAKMAPQFGWIADRLYLVPHGINPEDFNNLPNPYLNGLNAVSVGSGLFDLRFFLEVAPAFPEVQFHVIGAGRPITPLSNMRVYGEMKFRDTLPFIAHASFGIAPYRAEATANYVCDSSMKLMQYEYVGIPAVCPEFAVGQRETRFGYIPGNLSSIRIAIAAALSARDHIRPRRDFLAWSDVAQRILDPQAFTDASLRARSL